MDPSSSIDALLERYLALLDEYTTLRAELSRLQTGTFHNLARANFAAERGVRFGQDYYDARMQAGRRAVLSDAVGGVVALEVVKKALWSGHPGPGFEAGHAREEPVPEEPVGGEEEEEEEEEEEDDDDDKETEKPDAQRKHDSKDPIRWFGLLTPYALRQTQASAIDTVERVVPRLVTIDAEMRQVEIEVRRARKKRAKAEAAAVAATQQDMAQDAPRTEVAAA